MTKKISKFAIAVALVVFFASNALGESPEIAKPYDEPRPQSVGPHI